MIPFDDLLTRYNQISGSIENDVIHSLHNGQNINSYFTDRFERSLENYLGIDHVITTNSHTNAIQLLLEVLNITKGGVIVPNNSPIENAFGVTRAGAKPILCDVNSDTYLLDYDEVEDRLENNKHKYIKAVLVVDMYGQMPNMEKFYELCRKHKVFLLEDASHALGSRFNKMPVGYYSHAATVSFSSTDNLSGCGQGGGIITSDAELAKQIRIIINNGCIKKNEHIRLGGDYAMNAFMSIYLYYSLQKFESWNDNRRMIASAYNEAFSAECRPLQYPNGRHVYHLYEYKCESPESRMRIITSLRNNNITYGCHYPNLISDSPMYFGSHTPHLPNSTLSHTPVANALKQLLISLPIFPTMQQSQVNEVIESVLH